MSVNAIEELILLFSSLPGLGRRSARRIVLHLLQNQEHALRISHDLKSTLGNIHRCKYCHNLDVQKICGICADQKRNHSILCVVENIQDIWALEKNQAYSGLYHVLGGTISAMEGRTPESLGIDALVERVGVLKVQEVIIATNATLEGESTAHYIGNLLLKLNVRVTRIAHGIPMGAEIDNMDSGTLNLAMQMRKSVH